MYIYIYLENLRERLEVGTGDLNVFRRSHRQKDLLLMVKAIVCWKQIQRHFLLMVCSYGPKYQL